MRNRWKRSWYFLFVLFASVHAKEKVVLASSEEATHYQEYAFLISSREYQESTYFEIDAKGADSGTIHKKALNIWTNYELHSKSGEYVGRGSLRIVSKGGRRAWESEIDLYDSVGECLGLIQGHFLPLGPAYFTFCNDEGVILAVAKFNEEKMAFLVSQPTPSENPIALYLRDEEAEGWQVRVYDAQHLPPLFIRIFAAFVFDKQDLFLEE